MWHREVHTALVRLNTVEGRRGPPPQIGIEKSRMEFPLFRFALWVASVKACRDLLLGRRPGPNSSEGPPWTSQSRYTGSAPAQTKPRKRSLNHWLSGRGRVMENAPSLNSTAQITFATWNGANGSPLGACTVAETGSALHTVPVAGISVSPMGLR